MACFATARYCYSLAALMMTTTAAAVAASFEGN